MKATRRRSGDHMITVRVAHHLGGDELVAAVATQLWAGATDWGENPGVEATRAQVERAIRDRVATKGSDGFFDWQEEISNNEGEVDAVVEWAARQVRRWWPNVRVGQL